ncbi:MAG: T9SS type A sorting domain-containing protein, partial [Bacteroidales bacterium]|nr:T9SS type A sorting domain-containing protein [Bacteroidales bacterium]
AEITLDEPINEYTYLSIPFEEAGTPCDSLVVIIMAGTFGSADLGTAMWVDDVTISPYQVGLEESNAPKFYTYPNPATDYVRVAPAVSEPYTCRVLDLEGRLLRVVESNGEQCSVDVSDLASGLYMLKIDQNGKVANHKIVVR